MGTASSEIMDLPGMDGVDKDVLMNVLPKPFADKMLWILQKRLHPGMPDSGIAFTFPMSGGGGAAIW